MLAGLTLLLGCGDQPEGSTPEESMSRYVDLTARASLEDTTARYDTMQQVLRDRLDVEFGPFAWYEGIPASEGNCGSNVPNGSGGRTMTLTTWAFDGRITEWDAATRIVVEVIAEYGFALGGDQIEQGDVRLLNAFDLTLGAHFTFGTEVNTLLRTTTGCHLPAASRTG